MELIILRVYPSLILSRERQNLFQTIIMHLLRTTIPCKGGYRFFLNDEISALPSVMTQFVRPFAVQVHANVKMQYLDKLWVGASYRMTDQLGGFAAMAGINVSNTFNLGYAYDISTTSRLRNYTKNTHEIILGFLLNNKYGDTCPRNVW